VLAVAFRWFVFAVVAAVVLVASQPVYAVSGTYHWAYGKDDIYAAWDVNTDHRPLDSVPSGGTDSNKFRRRRLVVSILHLDLTRGPFAAGFKNIGCPAMWPRDTAYGVMTLDRAGIRTSTLNR
jgi:hypothetical protein